jgi:hypothetical protein
MPLMQVIDQGRGTRTCSVLVQTYDTARIIGFKKFEQILNRHIAS